MSYSKPPRKPKFEKSIDLILTLVVVFLIYGLISTVIQEIVERGAY